MDGDFSRRLPMPPTFCEFCHTPLLPRIYGRQLGQLLTPDRNGSPPVTWGGIEGKLLHK